MKLSVATNFDNALISKIKHYPVCELYGKLDSDFIGGGRSSYMLGAINKRKITEHVAIARANGISFNYLLNSSCLDNMETTREGQKKIRKLLDWISGIGVSAVTVANPFLLTLIKKKYSHLSVRVSVFACVDHLRKALFWQDNGADIICLDSHNVNRDFKNLKYIKENLICNIELMVNNNCLASCYMAHTHPNLMAHSSQAGHKSGGFVIDHCLLFCLKKKIEEPVNFIRSDWIRPEDLIYYERLGIENFKIVERNLPTLEMLKRVRAYSNRKYVGNLLDLVQGFGFKDDARRNASGVLHKLKFLFKPRHINIFKLGKIKKLCQRRGMLSSQKDNEPVFIDNQKLDGFINRFLNNGCRDIRCSDCKHCHLYAEKAITVDALGQADCLHLHEEVDELVASGDLWK